MKFTFSCSSFKFSSSSLIFKNVGPEHHRVASEKTEKKDSAPSQFEELLRRLEQCQEDPKQLTDELEKALKALEKECQQETLKCIEDGEVALTQVLDQMGVSPEEKEMLLEEYNTVMDPEAYAEDQADVNRAEEQVFRAQFKQQALSELKMKVAKAKKEHPDHEQKTREYHELKVEKNKLDAKMEALVKIHNARKPRPHFEGGEQSQMVEYLAQHRKISDQISAFQRENLNVMSIINQVQDEEIIQSGTWGVQVGENYYKSIDLMAKELAQSTISEEEQRIAREYGEKMKEELGSLMKEVFKQRLEPYCEKLKGSITQLGQRIKSEEFRFDPLRKRVKDLVSQGASANKITEAREYYEEQRRSDPILVALLQRRESYKAQLNQMSHLLAA
ncbi:MAG: hypothetical protein ACD_28C00011G0012 [uncultured bacterium]|nr:MAG: hypothetical protein ACD_28C00011G0012 [uncultured bacterium]KKT74258.1 MAG: hypothetical protein UW70_C0061G0013 [Candidatus Peregrinibacteria bacterium GW2011_GWA2_44_7]